MKQTLVYIFLFSTIAFTNCTRNFEEINNDPTKVSEEEFDPNYLLTAGQLQYGNVTEYQLYSLSCLTQHFSSTLDYYGGGDKYNQFLTAYNSRFFSDGMKGASQLLEAQNLALKKDANAYNNLIQMSRILWVLSMQRMTDVYGDIPYSQAGLGARGIIYPVYDRQEDIYRNMLTTLDDATTKLDESTPLAKGDLLYGGNIGQWKKLGYSVMLRVAMRLTKADATIAKKYAEKAAENTFSSISDNAILKLDGGPHELTVNSTANAILLNDFQQIRWSKTFIDYLISNNDPRLYALTEKADTGLAFNNNINHTALLYTKTNPAPAGSINEIPKGMPNGYDLSGSFSITKAASYPGPTGTGNNLSPLGNYARPKMLAFAKKDLPVFLISYAQTELLLAEAKARGWNVGITSAAQHYQNAIKGSLESLPQWDAAISVPADVISAFLSTHFLDVSSTENSLRQINSEYWVASLFDFVEAWSNWRRSGYPVLKSVNYPGNITNATIPRRLPYPSTNQQNNPVNYQIAIQRMGGTDVATTRVWWDK